MIDHLYKEYYRLLDVYNNTIKQLDGIARAIEAYGESVPDSREINKKDLTKLRDIILHSMYPENGTWANKIMYVLKRLNKPSTAGEVYQYIRDYEKIHEMNYSSVSNIIASTCSRLVKEGTIGLDASQKNNLYFLKYG